jgi:hypothetical protein
VSAPTLNFEHPTLNSRPRRGVTIIEVLFAILVTTVGLLGAIALFPVASSQARRARLNDIIGNAGRSAFHDFDTRGMRRPDRWLAWDQVAGAFRPVFPLPGAGLTLSNLQTAESFCIDPRMIAAHTTTSTSGPTTGQQFMTTASATGSPGGYAVQTFPYMEPYIDANGNSMFTSGETVNSDLNHDGIHDPPEFFPATFTFDSSLMRRITLWDGYTIPGTAIKRAMTLPYANSVFEVDDDLMYNRPTGTGGVRADASTQNATTLPTGSSGQSWGHRLSEGKVSWIATLVPQFDVSGVASDQYTLSIVMIHERPNRLDLLDEKMERVVRGVFQGIGATGGDIYLTASTADQLKLRPNDWVMVSGSYTFIPPGATASQTISRFQWYRISECDPEPMLNTSSTSTADQYELYATLMGRDWNAIFVNPPQPLPPALATTPAGQVRVTIVDGAFAVYEKSVRLEYGSTF